jgi:PAP_fibrillin
MPHGKLCRCSPPCSVPCITTLIKGMRNLALHPSRQLIGAVQIASFVSRQPDLDIPIASRSAETWLLTTYLDDTLRISRGDAGSIFVLQKAASAPGGASYSRSAGGLVSREANRPQDPADIARDIGNQFSSAMSDPQGAVRKAGNELENLGKRAADVSAAYVQEGVATVQDPEDAVRDVSSSLNKAMARGERAADRVGDHLEDAAEEAGDRLERAAADPAHAVKDASAEANKAVQQGVDAAAKPGPSASGGARVSAAGGGVQPGVSGGPAPTRPPAGKESDARIAAKKAEAGPNNNEPSASSQADARRRAKRNMQQ